MERPLVVVCEDLPGAARRRLASRCRVVDAGPGAAALPAALAEAKGLIVRTYTRVDADLLRRAPRLSVVGRAGVGLDNVDVAACRGRGIEVVYSPGANTQAVVEFTLQVVLRALRPLVAVREPAPPDLWHRLRREAAGRQLDELVVGILGLGRIGGAVAAAVGALGARVVYHDLLEIPPAARRGAEPRAAREVFAEGDVVSIHVDGRAANERFVDESLISRLKDDVILVNTSRGFVVDNVALAGFLRSHPRAQAHLDVHDPEPFGAGYPPLGLPNAHLYPHIAGRTEAALLRMADVVDDVIAVLEGRPPRFPAPAA